MIVLLEMGVGTSPVITHRLDHTEFEKGFEAMMSGTGGQVILDWTTCRWPLQRSGARYFRSVNAKRRA